MEKEVRVVQGRRDSAEAAGSSSFSLEDVTRAVSQGYYAALRRIVFLVAALILLYQLAGPISGILLLFLLVFIISAVLNPIAAWLEARGVPRTASAIGLVFLVLGALGVLLWQAVPPLLDQLGGLFRQVEQLTAWAQSMYYQLVGRFPEVAEQLPPPQAMLERFNPGFDVLFGRLTGYLMNVVSGFFALLVLIVLVIYTVAHPEPLIAGLLGAVPERKRDQTERALRRSMEQITRWAWASVVDGIIVGLLTWAGLHFLGVPNAPLFAVIAAVGELIPTFGPILASIPPILLSLAVDPVMALWVALFFVVLQQLESNLLAPLIIGGAMRLHPVSLLFTMLVMHSLFGVLGAILAVPVAGILKMCWEEFYLRPRHQDTETIEEHAEQIVSTDEDLGSKPDEEEREPGRERPRRRPA